MDFKACRLGTQTNDVLSVHMTAFDSVDNVTATCSSNKIIPSRFF